MDHELDYLMPDEVKPEAERSPSVTAEAHDQHDYLMPDDHTETTNQVDPDQAAKDAQDEYARWLGITGGATAGLLGSGTRAAGNLAANVLKNAFPGLRGENQSPGGKWFKKVVGDSYAAPEGNTSVKGAAESMQRQKSSGKITSRLEKKFGKLTPGSLNISGQAEPVISPEPWFWQGPEGETLRGAGRLIANTLSDATYGGLHALNAIVQGQAAMDSSDQSPTESALHGLSAAGSLADIASNIMPEVWRHGVRKYVSPLAVVGAGGADIAQGYNAATNPQQPSESPEEYRKRVYTGQMKIPSTLAKTAIGLINPIAGMASFSPPLSVDYAKTHPKQVQRWVDLGIYDNPESIKSGFPMRH
jgi:hypothetical protein